MDSLFDASPPAGEGPQEPPAPPAGAPLDVRMRPATLDDFVGQAHLLAPRSALRAAIESGHPHSIILFGPPGTG